jgi:hypothetical protein
VTPVELFIEAQTKLCFVVSPIGAADSPQRIYADLVLDRIIKPVVAGFEGYYVERADQKTRLGIIASQLIKDLLEADLVVADLSFHNPKRLLRNRHLSRVAEANHSRAPKVLTASIRGIEPLCRPSTLALALLLLARQVRLGPLQPSQPGQSRHRPCAVAIVGQLVKQTWPTAHPGMARRDALKLRRKSARCVTHWRGLFSTRLLRASVCALRLDLLQTR